MTRDSFFLAVMLAAPAFAVGAANLDTSLGGKAQCARYSGLPEGWPARDAGMVKLRRETGRCGGVQGAERRRAVVAAVRMVGLYEGRELAPPGRA
ncbi:hypothetical protein [Crenobacter cavernae]|uniref:hypothetical protein n=1 Tax=Crenobacter cavernae TaxID=2290923 RepID=UPI00196A4F8F|nr:hypothetical protein [Crenobacter cavernae]